MLDWKVIWCFIKADNFMMFFLNWSYLFEGEFDISLNLMMSLWNDGCYCHQGVGGKKQGQGASVNININISISINININANININVSISIKINITSSDDAKYIQQWRERALKAQGRPIPKIGSRLLISSSYIQQDFSWHLDFYLCGHSPCALIKCTASPTYILYDYDKKDPLKKFEL